MEAICISAFVAYKGEKDGNCSKVSSRDVKCRKEGKHRDRTWEILCKRNNAFDWGEGGRVNCLLYLGRQNMCESVQEFPVRVAEFGLPQSQRDAAWIIMLGGGGGSQMLPPTYAESYHRSSWIATLLVVGLQGLRQQRNGTDNRATGFRIQCHLRIFSKRC